MKGFVTLAGLAAAVLAVGAPTEAPPATAPPSEAVVREIVKIQEQLGGSIVKGSELESLAPQPAVKNQPTDPPSPVKTLRDAAWQLEKSAHELELADLYSRADEVRALAEELRLEARELKSAAKKPE